MNVLGTKVVRLDKLQMPGDLRRRMETVNVAELEEGLKKWGKYIHDPLIRERDMRIICGRDRLAGAKKAGRDKLEVKLVDCTDEEAEELELVENLHRRHDPDEETEMRQAYLALMERKAAAAGDDKEPRGAGRRETPRGQARAALAEKLGVSKNAIEAQDRRVAAKKEAPKEPGPSWGEEEEEPEGELPPPVELLGTEPEADWLVGVAEVQALLDQADQKMREVQAALTKLQKVAMALPEARWQRLFRAAHALAHELRASRPVSVCPYCKLVPSLRGVCTACGLQGYIVDEQTAGIPAELLNVGARLVAQRGRFIPMDTVKEKAAAWEAARGGAKKMKLLDAEGKPIDVDGG